MADAAPSKRTVYIADDDKFISDVYTTQFQEKGIEVIILRDGQEVVKALETRQPDLLVLDLHMPKIDGIGVLEFARSHHYTFPILIVSNLRQESDIEKCRELGAADFIVKSDITLKELWAKVRQFLQM